MVVRGAGLATARSWVRIPPPVAAVYQRQRGRLMSTSESWGVNGHTTRCTSPYPSAGVRLWVKETGISATP